MNNRILAIDYGAKRIGLAISDEYAKLALPYDVIENKSLSFVIKELDKIIKQEEVGELVAGLPKGLNNQESNNRELDKFIGELKKTVGLPVVLFDERMTSKAADKFKLIGDSKKTGWRDKVAATIILQNYLDSINK